MKDLIKEDISDVGLNKLKEQRSLIAEKWGKLGLLDGLSGHIDPKIVQLYECSASWLIPEEENDEKI